MSGDIVLLFLLLTLRLVDTLGAHQTRKLAVETLERCQ